MSLADSGAPLPDPGPDPGSLERGNFTYFPVVPGRLEFALELRRLLLERRPQIIAVELPGFLEEAYLEAAARLPEISAIVFEDPAHDDEGVYLIAEPCDPFLEAVRTGLETGTGIEFIEPDAVERPHLRGDYPDPYAIRRIGLRRYIEAYRVYPQPRSDEITAHAAAMAWKLQGTDPMASVLVVVSLNLLDPLLDAMEMPQDAPPPRRWAAEPRLLNVHPGSLAEVMSEYPYLQERYERFRLQLAQEELIDRPRAQLDLLRDAERAYVENTGDRIEHWQRRLLARYTRNLARTAGDLTAGLFDITVAARSIVDDNFAWDVWETAGRYPAQTATHESLETVNLSGEQVWLDTKKIRLRRRLPRPKQMYIPRGLKRRKKENFPGEWARQTSGNAICSYPPEDLVIEDYGRLLKQKAKSMVSEERMRTEPYLTSILDGIDLRETIRNWHIRPSGEPRIYVRKQDRLGGEVGAVVVVFDEDRDDRYTYLTTWLGEHQNESDMAFYSTQPFEHLVGPGIGRAEYGGFLMVLPPRRMYDIWTDPDYEFALNKPERLLMAAIDYSVQRFVVYVAKKPPRSIFRSIAAKMNRRILYVPMGVLSPAKLKKLRAVHVLDGYDRRKDAKQFIW
ncbi:MAG TPA: hypothetical protein VLT57_13645 [Bryobacteraceae bacterium]|nr:hypothetical protein [Bryobacteraceae bacterium]